MPDVQAAFDTAAAYYDILVDWEHRLPHEAPFFQRVFGSVSARRVLDCACGTGQHARLFARWGLQVVGTDASPAMIERARRDTAGGRIRFEVADFTDLGAEALGGPFDAVVCTGNSLPLAGSAERVRQAVRAMYDATTPGGVVVLHTLNYARIPEGANQVRGPRVRQVEDREILFLKVFRKVRRLCDLDLVVLEKQAGAWSKFESHARAWAVEQPDLEQAAGGVGYVRFQWYGGYEPKPFDPATSNDLILVARRE